jgi:hypothetical protein
MIRLCTHPFAPVTTMIGHADAMKAIRGEDDGQSEEGRRTCSYDADLVDVTREATATRELQ